MNCAPRFAMERWPQSLSRGGLTCKGRPMNLKDEVIQDNLKTPRRFLGLRLAQTAGFVQDAIQLAAQNRQQLRETWEHQKKVLGMDSTNDPKPTSGEDDVGNIVVGDQQTTVYNMAPAEPKQSSTFGKFAKAAAIGAALLGSGGVGAIGTAWLCGLFDKPKSVVIPPQPKIEFPDQDGYGIRIFEDAK